MPLGGIPRSPMQRALVMDDSTDRKRQPERSKEDRKGERPDVEAAFDLWLQRGLHQLYDGVASEPVPEDLLKLIEEDRVRRNG